MEERSSSQRCSGTRRRRSGRGRRPRLTPDARFRGLEIEGSGGCRSLRLGCGKDQKGKERLMRGARSGLRSRVWGLRLRVAGCALGGESLKASRLES
eukprot:1316380-Rhodomonas_salina.1